MFFRKIGVGFGVHVLCVAALAAAEPLAAHAFTPVGHEQITKAALNHIVTHPRANSAFDLWMSGLSAEDQATANQVLIRSTVDLDFLPNLWGKILATDTLVGGFKDNEAAVFTCFFHFIDVTKPGRYWDYDGFAYRNRWGATNDVLLGLPFSAIRSDISPTLGGSCRTETASFDLGVFRGNFRGTSEDWKRLFFGADNAKRAVFPPAYVPAEIGLSSFLASPIAAATDDRLWYETLPLLKPLFKKIDFVRWYWTATIKGLPSAFDKLGYPVHMAQDMCEPHHTQGTLDFCHFEAEHALDTLNCGAANVPSYLSYSDGSYKTGALSCDKLYDAELVEALLAKVKYFQPGHEMTISQRLIGLAQLTGHWRWGDPTDSVDPIGTVLPDGKSFTGDTCADVLGFPEVQEQLRLQYNLAVAASVALLRFSADEYELAHAATVN